MRGGDIFMGAFNAEQVMYNHFGYRTPIPEPLQRRLGRPSRRRHLRRRRLHRGRHHRARPRAQAVVDAVGRARGARGDPRPIEARRERPAQRRIPRPARSASSSSPAPAKASAASSPRPSRSPAPAPSSPRSTRPKRAAVSAEIMRAGGEALAVTTDVAEEASIKEMVEIVDRPLRPHRRADQQCRHLLDAGDAAVRPDSARGMGARAARQPDRTVSVRARGAAGDAARANGAASSTSPPARCGWDGRTICTTSPPNRRSPA